MKVTSRFTIGIHAMLVIASFSDKLKVTSDFIAKSTNANPVIIRRIMGQLKAANLVSIRAGVGGASITRPYDEITLLDIFNAVEAMGDDFFSFQANPNCQCPIGRNIHVVLDRHLMKVQDAMNQEMEKTTLQMLLDDTKHLL